MRALIASILSVAALAAVCAAPAAALEPPDDGLPLARQIEILAPLGARDDLTARALRSYGFQAARQARVYEADAILRPLAEAGDREALYAYVDLPQAHALAYDHEAASLALLKRAADRGDLRASALYAWRKLTGENDRYFDRDWLEANPDLIDPMIARLRNAAESGDPHGKAYWGAFQFVESAIVSRSHDLGERLLREAATANVAFAHRMLGVLTQAKTTSFFRDSDAARRHYRAAIDLGDRKAFEWLMLHYQINARTGRDTEEYRQALHMGFWGVEELGSYSFFFEKLPLLTLEDAKRALRFILDKALTGDSGPPRLLLSLFYWDDAFGVSGPAAPLFTPDPARRVAWLLLAWDARGVPLVARITPAETAEGKTAQEARDARALEWLRNDMRPDLDLIALEQALDEGAALAAAFRRGERAPLLEPLEALLLEGVGKN